MTRYPSVISSHQAVLKSQDQVQPGAKEKDADAAMPLQYRENSPVAVKGVPVTSKVNPV